MDKTGIEPRIQNSKVRSLPLDDIIRMQAQTQVEAHMCHTIMAFDLFFLI